MSGQPKTITQTSKTQSQATPWAPTTGAWQNLINTTEGAMQNVQGNPFTGQFLAQTTPFGTQGVDFLKNLIPTLGQGSQDVINLGQKTARGDFLDPSTNPFIKAAADAAVGRVNEGLMQQALPAITDSAIASGAYGGARQDLSQERAVRDFSRSALDATSMMYAQNYANERQLQQGAPALLGAGYELAAAPGNALLSLDEISRGQTQLGLDNQLAQFREQQAAQFYGIPELSAVLGMTTPFASNTGSGTMTQPNPNYTNPFMQVAQGLLGGAATVAGLGGPQGFNLWGRKAA